METHYKYYTADQLLNDPDFLQAELHPTLKNRKCWDDIASENKSFADELSLARKILARIKEAENSYSLQKEEEARLWKRIQDENKKSRLRKTINITLATAGVAAVLALVFIINFYNEKEKENANADYMAIIETAKQAEDKSGNIQLLLSDNKKLNLHGKESEIEYEKEGDIRINSEKVQMAQEEKKEQSFNTLIVPVGKRSFVTLAEGTKIWVNSDTKVIYPVQFAAAKREIYVEGEIYLDVSPNEKAPFVVKTKDSQITVLGTQFNVTAYGNESNTNILLVEGKVEVELPGKSKNILSANQMISFNNETKSSSIKEVNVIDYIAWKDGYYQFRKQPMDIVLNRIAKYYGLKIEWDDPVGQLTCSGKLDLKDDPRDIFSTLQKAAPIEINSNNERIEIKVKP